MGMRMALSAPPEEGVMQFGNYVSGWSKLGGHDGIPVPFLLWPFLVRALRIHSLSSQLLSEVAARFGVNGHRPPKLG